MDAGDTDTMEPLLLTPTEADSMPIHHMALLDLEEATHLKARKITMVVADMAVAMGAAWLLDTILPLLQ